MVVPTPRARFILLRCPDSGHAYNKTQPFNVRGKKTHKKQPEQQKQEKNPVNTNF